MSKTWEPSHRFENMIGVRIYIYIFMSIATHTHTNMHTGLACQIYAHVSTCTQV